MKTIRLKTLLSLSILLLVLASIPAARAENTAMPNVLPAGGFAEGWVMDGKPARFTEETLFDHINGEAELYFPYGFEALATARYVRRGAPASEIVAEVYRMGSLLDAFGIYSNYRKAGAPKCDLGGGCTSSASQFLFYQDRYFVRLQATGTPPAQDVFLACGRSISKNLPAGKGPPAELELVHVRGIVAGTERYIPQSLLGYPFFRRGLTAEANPGGERTQVFVVLDESASSARKTFGRYFTSLKEAGKDARLTSAGERVSLEGFDPLYGKVTVEQSGRYLIGAIRLKDPSAVKPILEEMKAKTRSRP